VRIKLVIAYDGTDFYGWDTQHELRTVRGTLTEAVRLVSDEVVTIRGSSRTDAGTHAKGQIAHFDTTRPIPSEQWAEVLNRRLPPDVAVLRSDAVPDHFDSRFCVRSRAYRYRFLIGERDPHRAHFTHRFYRQLDLDAMRDAASLLTGSHDFLAFTEGLEGEVANTVRTLFSVRVSAVRDEVRVDVIGTAFLRGMMRRISGALLEVGRGQRSVEEVSRLLDPRERENEQWPIVLPANGLCLERIRLTRGFRDTRPPLA